MREINFRGKSTKDNKWVYGDLIHTPTGGRRIIWFENTFSDSVDDYEDFNEQIFLISAGKTTKEKDKNGKTIFEGDIVNDEELGKGIVIFQSGCFFMMYDADINMEFLGLKTNKFGSLQEKRVVEIIGNIHDNPEILLVTQAII